MAGYREGGDSVEQREGVIKFRLDFQERQCITREMTAELNGWRHVLHRLGLIGQEPDRYKGLGFGNISCRTSDVAGSFLISGTQTGKAPFLSFSEYALVTECDPLANSIRAVGLIQPSSEALTHGQLYLLDTAIGSVVHAHSPEIWRRAEAMGLPCTPPDVAYGTAEMAREVGKLFSATPVWGYQLFVMGGHEDGVVSFGRNLQDACGVMIATLASAVAG